MGAKTILISGLGIAGPTLAFWLRAGGFQPTLIERAPTLRSGGYVIDFWGLGYDIAERMGLSTDINQIGYHIQEMRVVNRRRNRVSGFGTQVFVELTGGRYVTIPRSALSRLLVERIADDTEIILGDEIDRVRECEDGVEVQFAQGGARKFDLIVGADGLHSKVRRLIFGPQERFEKQLGYVVAAFETKAYRPRDEDVYVMFGDPGRMVGRVALRDDRTLFLFVFIAEKVPTPPSVTCRCRKRYCAHDFPTNPGNADKFSTLWIRSTIFTSIVSARSGCLIGHKDGSRSLAMLLIVCRCWRGRAPLSR